MSRIIYISTRSTAPTGGVKVIFEHVAALRELGFDAYVGHPIAGYRPDWFRTEVPLLYYLQGMKVFPDDVFVIPETGYNTLRLLKAVKGRKIVFCQNQFGVFQGLGEVPHWRDFGVSAVIACSEVVARVVARFFGYARVPVIPCPIDHLLFQPGDKKPQIAYMPRKRARDAAFIRAAFSRLGPDFARAPWVAIDGVPETEVARILGESAIFLSLSHREGLGLPPLEAMAAGCMVAGFRGIGGLEYATQENGLWCTEDDPFDCALQLGHAWQLLRPEHQVERTALRDQGHATAKRYTRRRMTQALGAFWADFLYSDPISPTTT